MALNNLSEDEKRIVSECLRASAEGPFFPEWEFHILFGISREDIIQILSRWPDIDEQDEKIFLAVNNSMNNLTGYPHGCQDIWSSYISVSQSEVSRILDKWRDGYTDSDNLNIGIIHENGSPVRHMGSTFFKPQNGRRYFEQLE